MRWAVEIQKTGLERRNLEDVLSALGIELVEGIEYPAFTSDEINQCTHMKEVHELAKKLRTSIRDVTGTDPDFTLGVVIDFSEEPPRRHHFLEADSGCFQLNFSSEATLTVRPPSGLSESDLAEWHRRRDEQAYQVRLEKQLSRLIPAHRSHRAAKVIELLKDKKPTGLTLFKIYELMEGKEERKMFHKRLEISAEEFLSFSDAVHNPAVTGDWARHSNEQKPKSGKPMTKEEAENFISRISARWLNCLRHE